MAEEEKDSKTEEPTGRKLGRARGEGQVPISQEVKSLFMLVAALVVVGLMTPSLALQLRNHLGGLFANAHAVPLDPEGFRSWFLHALLGGILIVSPVFALAFFAALVSGFVQFGFLFAPKKIVPKLSNISPLAGFRRIFSKNQLVELGKSIFKLLIVLSVLMALVIPNFATPELYISLDPIVSLDHLHDLLILVFLGVILSFFTVAVVDWWWQRHRHREQLKMTKQEVKEEHKDTEGDPQIKGRIRQLRLQRHRERMMASVPEASVIITNPTHYAVALKYDMDDMPAPKVVAKGIDSLALRIRALAEEYDVPVTENPPLARALYSSVELDQEIPPEHYKAVAEVIGYVMKLKRAGLTGRGRRPSVTDRTTERGRVL